MEVDLPEALTTTQTIPPTSNPNKQVTVEESQTDSSLVIYSMSVHARQHIGLFLYWGGNTKRGQCIGLVHAMSNR